LNTNFKKWQRNIFVVLWITYGSIYLIRANFSVAIPGIMAEFGWSRTDLGVLATVFLWTYALGHFVNGQLGDRMGSRKMLAIGFGTAVLATVVFPFSPTLGVMTLVWAVNGWAQSMGWGPTVKTLSRWFPTAQRGRAGGLLGTSYILGGGAASILTGYIIINYGWRAGFWIPAIIVAATTLHWFLRVKESPEDVGLSAAVEFGSDTPKYPGLKYTLKQSFGNKLVWIMGGGLFFVNLVRYGFLTWAPTIFFETQQIGIDKAAYKTIVFPIAGALGALTTGWLSDKLFGSRRAPLAALALGLTAILVTVFALTLRTASPLVGLAMLAGAGYAINGANVMIIVSAPMDLGTRKAASSATGFIDGMGYIGAGVQGIVTGWLVDTWGWIAGLGFWVVCAVLGAALVATMWNHHAINPPAFAAEKV